MHRVMTKNNRWKYLRYSQNVQFLTLSPICSYKSIAYTVIQFRRISLLSLEKASANHRTVLLQISAEATTPICQKGAKKNSLDAHRTFGPWKYVLHEKAGSHNEPPAGVRPKMEVNRHLGRSTAMAPWRTTKLYCCWGDRAKTWYDKATSNRP